MPWGRPRPSSPGRSIPRLGLSVEDGEDLFLEEYVKAAVDEDKARLISIDAEDYFYVTASDYSEDSD